MEVKEYNVNNRYLSRSLPSSVEYIYLPSPSLMRPTSYSEVIQHASGNKSWGSPVRRGLTVSAVSHIVQQPHHMSIQNGAHGFCLKVTKNRDSSSICHKTQRTVAGQVMYTPFVQKRKILRQITPLPNP